jgi:hypothetical protein
VSRIPRPAHRFRVYPNPPTKWRYEVCVFASQADMYEYARRTWGQETTNYYAICLSSAPSEIKGRKLGEILFTLRELTHKLIAHESSHAATHWMSVRTGRDAVIIHTEGCGHDTEEWVAAATGNIVEQVIASASARGIAIT